MTESPSNRDEFLANVRRALDREADPTPDAPPAQPSHAPTTAEEIMIVAAEGADGLFDEAERSAINADWKVYRADSPAEAADYIAGIVRDLGAGRAVRSGHRVLDDIGLDAAMEAIGVEITTMVLSAKDREAESAQQRTKMRQKAIHADVGITGADYVIAETGTCVLLPREELSRVVSLLPPVHVAVVRKGQVLPSLDELFALLHAQQVLPGDTDIGGLHRYGSLISGPSRTGDIDQTITTGVHGPGEVHLVMLG